MIRYGEKWHYLTVRSLSALLKGITSNRTKKVLKKHMKICEDKNYCYIEMPEKGASVLNPSVKSMRAPYAIFADIESLLKKMDAFTNDTDKSSTKQLKKPEMCGYSLVTHCSFDEKNNAIDRYRGKDCLKKFCLKKTKKDKLNQ